jgi:hypothetical protein
MSRVAIVWNQHPVFCTAAETIGQEFRSWEIEVRADVLQSSAAAFEQLFERQVKVEQSSPSLIGWMLVMAYSGPNNWGLLVKHTLGVLGVLAAGVLLAVSAAMNWRFGYHLGKTEMDGQIYGAASAAADCFKALVPFFLFAAIRNKMWSQAAAAAVLWVVVTGYSLTSALGHAALNRNDTTGQRAVEASSYKDLRADLKRAQDQAAGLPKHRPALMVQAELDAQKSKQGWKWTNGCTDAKNKFDRDFCQVVHTLGAEVAVANQSEKLEARIVELNTKIGKATGTVHADADPQAAVLTKIGNLVFPNLKLEDVQMGLTIFVALLLEIGSGFGMYVAFSPWRQHDQVAPSRVAEKVEPLVVVEHVPQIAAPIEVSQVAVAQKPHLGANDNTNAAPAVTAPTVAVSERAVPQTAKQEVVKQEYAKQATRAMPPETDVERFYKERIESTEGSSLTATTLYEDYCAWCEEQQKEPLALPTFGREFGDLGVQKAKVAGRVRYIGISLRSGLQSEEDRRHSERIVQAA